MNHILFHRQICIAFHVATFLIATMFLGAGHLSAQQKGSTIVNTIGMKLTVVPAGEFLMGAEEDPSDTLAAFPYARR